jgi:hypothetical protein
LLVARYELLQAGRTGEGLSCPFSLGNAMKHLFLVGLLLVPLTDLAAQETPSIEPGDLVRVWRAWPFDYWKEGSVVSLNADTLVIKEKPYHTTLILPFESLEKFEVRRGQGITGKYWQPMPLRKLSSITPGTRVRIRRPSLHPPDLWLLGTAVALDADTIVVQVDGRAGTVAVSRASIAELNVSVGKSRDKGAIWGAALGFAAGNIYHKIINPPEYRCTAEKEGGDCNAVFFFFTDGAIGVPFGALIGMLVFAEERWEPVSLPLQVGFSPHGGAHVALRFKFGR